MIQFLLAISMGAFALAAPSQTNPALAQITPAPLNPFAQPATHDNLPTTSPNPEWAGEDLKKRQQQIEVCGYLNGQAAFPYYCDAGTECRTDSELGFAGCCPAGIGAACPMPTACVPYSSLGLCGVGCADNPHMLLCPSIEYPNCVSVEMRLPSETLWSYGCAVPELTTHLTVYWTGKRGAPTGAGTGAPAVATLTTTPSSGLSGGNAQGVGRDGNNFNMGDGAVVNITNSGVKTIRLSCSVILVTFLFVAVFL